VLFYIHKGQGYVEKQNVLVILETLRAMKKMALCCVQMEAAWPSKTLVS